MDEGESQVLRFLGKEEISNIIDDPANKVISYLLKKVLFSQPERLVGQKENNIQMTKEFLEQWVAQGLGIEVVGSGNYPIDAIDVKNKKGYDIKFLSAETNQNGDFTNRSSNETSLAQNFAGEGDNLDQLFSSKDYDQILANWKKLLIRKLNKAMEEKNLKKIFYFIFIRGGSVIYLSVAELDISKIESLNTHKSTGKSVFVEGFCDPKYGNVKIYKSKKRMELRTFPKKLQEDNKLIEWDFTSNYSQKEVALRELIKDEKKFKEYLKKEFDSLFL